MQSHARATAVVGSIKVSVGHVNVRYQTVALPLRIVAAHVQINNLNFNDYITIPHST